MFAGRKEEVQKVEGWLKQRRSVDRRVLVISVEGPGGIGKTMLVTHALNSVLQTPEYAEQSYLLIRTEGKGELDDPGQWILGAARYGAKNRPGTWEETFRQTGKVIERLRVITEAAKNEIGAGKLSTEQLEAAKLVIKGGLGLLRKLPKLKEYVPNISETDLDRVLAVLSKMKSMNAGGLHRFQRSRNAVRLDPDGELVRAFVGDLGRILRGSGKRRKGLEHVRLLWILDDYEALPTSVHHFFVEQLVGELESADFETTIVLLGRDRLWDTHPAWSRRFRHVYDGSVLPLKAFSDSEIVQLCKAEGISDDSAIARIRHESSGYPLLVDWAVREVVSGGKGIRASALQNFYDRITQWMTSTEKTWFNAIVFLPEVNMSTLPLVFPTDNGETLGAILAWFKREASIRESDATSWVVKPYVQLRVLKLFSIDDPVGCADRLSKTGLVWHDPFDDSNP